MISLLFLIAALLNKNVIFYVGKADVLPEPLSREKEEEYLCLSEQGDQKAKDILIEQNCFQNWNLYILELRKPICQTSRCVTQCGPVSKPAHHPLYGR